MTSLVRRPNKPAKSAYVYLMKKWELYVSECENINKRTMLNLHVADLAPAIERAFDACVETAYRHWGSMDVEDTLKEIGFEYLTGKGLPRRDDYDRILYRAIEERKKEKEEEKKRTAQ